MILGANGQLGSDLSLVLSHQPNLNVIQITRKELDVCNDIGKIEEKLTGYNAAVIINCIATTNVDWCEDNSIVACKLIQILCYNICYV